MSIVIQGRIMPLLNQEPRIPMTTVARNMGVSRQRVYQIIHEGVRSYEVFGSLCSAMDISMSGFLTSLLEDGVTRSYHPHIPVEETHLPACLVVCLPAYVEDHGLTGLLDAVKKAEEISTKPVESAPTGRTYLKIT